MIGYFGNIVSIHGNTPTFIEILGPKLGEYFPIYLASSKKGKIARLTDMILSFYRNKAGTKLILIDTYSTSNFWYAYILAIQSRFFGIPYIPIVRGGNLKSRLENNPRLCKKLFGKAGAIVSPSEFLVKTFLEYGYQVAYIPNFIDLENYPYRVRESIRPRFFWIRSFQDVYNPLLAIEVLHKIKAKYPNAEMFMAGPDKGQLQEVKQLIDKHNLSDSVTLMGKMSKYDWVTAAGEYDIFLNTTNFDNRPVTIMEAMAIGIPIISTDAGGLPDLIDHGINGILVPTNSVGAFVNAIENLIENPDRARQLAENARDKIMAFDWSRVKQTWINQIENVL